MVNFKLGPHILELNLGIPHWLILVAHLFYRWAHLRVWIFNLKSLLTENSMKIEDHQHFSIGYCASVDTWFLINIDVRCLVPLQCKDYNLQVKVKKAESLWKYIKVETEAGREDNYRENGLSKCQRLSLSRVTPMGVLPRLFTQACSNN